ncbi:MAG: sensor histidine kinase [Eubacterium sp.]
MVETIFELGINLIETFIIIDFITRYLGCKYRDKRRYIGFITAWSVYFTELSIINYIFPGDEGIYALIPIIISFTYALIFLNGSIQLKLWISALSQICITIIAYGTNLLVCQVIGYDPNDMITVFNTVRVISVIITKIILFYITRMILRHRYKNPLDNRVWIMLIIIPVISIFSLSSLMFAALNHSEISGYILCGMSGILLANIITYYFFSTLNKAYETKLEIKLLRQNNENAKKNIENADAFVQQMKSVRHDMRNQLLIISNYIDNEKYCEAKDYINNLTDSYLPTVKNFINTENDAFNAIVNSKIAVCNQKNIYIEIKEMRNALKDFDPIDTGVLFGNLLDNAIEAAQATESRRITVDIKQKGCYLSVLATNSIKTSVLENNTVLETTKSDKSLHGIGIKTIKALVEKYDGMIQFYEENGEFCCHIMLYNSKD